MRVAPGGRKSGLRRLSKGLTVLPDRTKTRRQQTFSDDILSITTPHVSSRHARDIPRTIVPQQRTVMYPTAAPTAMADNGGATLRRTRKLHGSGSDVLRRRQRRAPTTDSQRRTTRRLAQRLTNSGTTPELSWTSNTDGAPADFPVTTELMHAGSGPIYTCPRGQGTWRQKIRACALQGVRRQRSGQVRGDLAGKDPRMRTTGGDFAPKDPRMRTRGGTSRQKIRACALQRGLRAKRSAVRGPDRSLEAKKEGRGPLGTSERRRESTAHEANRRRKQDRGGGSGEFRHRPIKRMDS